VQQQTKTPASYTLSLEEVQALQFRVSTHRAKAKIGKLTPETIREYRRRNDQLQAGADIGSSCKKERYLWKAAGEWGFKIKMAALLKEADKVRSAKGMLEAVRMLGWKTKVEEMERLAKAWDRFSTNKVWKAAPAEIVRKQADHKKQPATDDDLVAFHASKTTLRSQYREHFVAAEFSGARPEEFGGVGVGIELTKYQGKLALRFWIEGAKQGDGSKGQPLRTVLVPFPQSASVQVQQRWHGLAKNAGASPDKRFFLTVDESAKLTAGQKLSRAFANCAKKMERTGPALSMYSLRHRFSAQVKESNDDAAHIAELLGHQSTETQRHYGRRRRGGSGVSPGKIVSDGAGQLKDVRNYRDRKGSPVKPKAPKAPATPAASAVSPTLNLAAIRPRAAPSIPRGPRPPQFG
jgi:integrase